MTCNIYDKISDGLYLGQEEVESKYRDFDLCINFNYPNNGIKKGKIKMFEDNKGGIRIYIGIIDGCVNRKVMMKLWDLLGKYIDLFLKGGKRVIVNCYAGRSRSASCVIAYLIKHKGMSFREAHDYVKSKRDCIDINRWFEKNLNLYDKKWNS